MNWIFASVLTIAFSGVVIGLGVPVLVALSEELIWGPK